jgi:ATP-binding protein involved in chromosome partitioning
VPVSDEEVPVIAVASGKGGVGKTTVAVNLALALRDRGLRVGLVDADLYGPDVPRMLGLRREREARHLTVFAAQGSPGSRLQAIDRHGIQIASTGLLVGERQGVGVDAGIAQLLVRRLISDTEWGDLDCMVVDLPPGTADIQQFVFSLARRMLLVLLVVTPQVIAHQDVRRLIAHLHVQQAVSLGGVENMSGMICPSCGDTTPMFPSAPADQSVWAELDKLASIPFSPQAASDADDGKPVLLTRAVPQQVAAFEALAEAAHARISEPPPERNGQAGGPH